MVTRHATPGIGYARNQRDALGRFLEDSRPQGALASSVDAQSTHTYEYDAATGLNTKIGTNNITRAGTGAGSTVTLAGAQALTHTFDTAGRVNKRKVGTQETNYTYGPQNQIETVTGPSGAQFDYLYDESGMRLAKVRRSDGEIMLAYLGAGVHDGAALTTPISIAGVNIGTLRKGKLTAHASDIRGTVLGATAGTGISSSPSPYGARSIEPDVASVTSFIEQPFDRDLGLVRLGVRDYDPKLGRFIQPDPLYHELPGFTLGDHVGANLYSYANNDPVNFVDPTGLYSVVRCTNGRGEECYSGEGPAPSYVQMHFEQVEVPETSYEQQTAGDAALGAIAGQQLLTEWDSAVVLDRAYRQAGKAAGTRVIANLGYHAPNTRTQATVGVYTGPDFKGIQDTADAVLRTLPWVSIPLNAKDYSQGKISGFEAAVNVVGGKVVGKLAGVLAGGTIGASARGGTGVLGRGFPALEGKFAKHAAEWGAGNITKLGYAKRAESLMSSPIGGNIQGFTRQTGEILRYNVRTNELAIANADGTIATMFRPVEGLQYWLQQLVP